MPEVDPKLEPQPTVEPAPEVVADWESEGGAVLPPGMALTLHGPEGAGPEELIAALSTARRALPEGFRLERT